jgi:hypothetical protein
VSRVINATMRSDTQYNTVNSYFMVHFIYRLNLFGDKESRSEMRSRMSERGGRPELPMGGGGLPMRGGFGGPGGGFGGPGGGFGPM